MDDGADGDVYESGGDDAPSRGEMMRLTVFILMLSVTAGAREQPAAFVVGPLGQRLDGLLQRATGGGFWGAALVAIDGKVVLAKGYGNADYGSLPNRAQTCHEIASASKQFTAAAILKLRMQGKLKLTDTLAKYWPDLPRTHRAITVHQLLTHTSGISERTGISYNAPHTREQAIEAFCDKRLASTPGTEFEYSNAGYAILAAIVEKASGKSFEEYSRKHLFGAADLTSTGFIRDDRLGLASISTRLGRNDTAGAIATKWHWSWGYRGMGGVVTNVLDLLAWDQALRTNKILDADARKVLYEPVEASRAAQYACGWRIESAADGTRKAVHSGGVEGYACNVVRYLEKNAMIVLLSNGKSNVHQLTATLEAALFPPPRVTLAVDVTGYKLNQHRAVEPARAAWIVQRTTDGVDVTLQDLARKHALAVIHLPKAAAVALRKKLERFKDKPARGAPDHMEAGTYLGPYTLQGGKLKLEDHLSINVMPSYRGVGPNRKPIIDQRVTLVVTDTDRRQWPLMAKMNPKSLRVLLEALQKLDR